MDTSSCIITSDEAKHTSGEVQGMNFWKKLFAGMGFVCGFLVFETMSLAYHNSSRRHKNCKGRCRRNSFWDTLTRYMIFAWIYDGVKKSREQGADGTTAAPGTSFDRPTIPAQETIPLNLQKPPRKPQMQHSPKSSGRLRLHRKRTDDRGAVSGQAGTSRFKDLVLK